MGSVAFLTLFILFCSSAASAEDAHRVQVYAHRGVRSYVPENTLPGYVAALRIGTDWVDMDVVLTKDQHVVVSHDPVFNPDIARDATGKFLGKSARAVKESSPADRKAYIARHTAKSLTLAEVQRYDVGRLNPESPYARFFPDQRPMDGLRMPTLTETVHLVKSIAKDKVGFQIEMKTNPQAPETSADPVAFARAVYKVLKDEDIIGRSEIQAFDFRCLYALQQLDSRVRTAYLTSRDNEPGGAEDFAHASPEVAGLWTGGKFVKDYQGSIPRMVKALGGYAWDPEDAELTRATLSEAHALGLKVVVWSWPEKLGTAFDAKLAQTMIDWGVDGIISDDPGRLISLLAARAMPVPPRIPPGN